MMSSIVLLTSSVNAGGLGDLLNSAKDIIQKQQNILNSNQNEANNTNSNLDCNTMLKNSPKKSVTENYAKDVLVGAAVGAAIGAAISSEDRAKGAMLGAVVGMAAGLAKARISNQEIIGSSAKRDELIKKYQPPYLDIVEFKTKDTSFNDKNQFKNGDYIFVLLRFHGLREKPEDSVPIRYKITLYKDNEVITTFFDDINLPQGESVDYFVIPVCKDTKPGNYTLKIKVFDEINSKEDEVKWSIVN